MDLTTLLIIVGAAVAIVILGRILSHTVRFAFYALLVALAAIFIFGISFSDILSFIRDLVFLAF